MLEVTPQAAYPFIDDTLSNADYHSRSEISKSDLDIILQSPAKLEYIKNSPKKQTPAMLLGSLFHTLVLQPELLDQEYAIEFEEHLMSEFKTPEGKTDKQAWEDYKFKRDNFRNTIGRKSIISIEMLATANAMKNAVMSHPTARALLLKSKVESSAFWIDKTTGIPCRCRPDASWPYKILIDLKSIDDASYNNFRRQIVARNYDMQAAHYLDGYSESTGVIYDKFVFIVCEKLPPYGVAVYEINEAVIECGRNLRDKALRQYSEWINRDREQINSIYPNAVQKIDMAAYGFSYEDR